MGRKASPPPPLPAPYFSHSLVNSFPLRAFLKTPAMQATQNMASGNNSLKQMFKYHSGSLFFFSPRRHPSY